MEKGDIIKMRNAKRKMRLLPLKKAYIKSKEKQKMAEILEIIMILSFGASWPMNVVKSYKARSAKGKSISFLILIFLGYVAGIASKFANEVYMASFAEKWYVLVFYFINITMVSADILLYVRNRKLDKLAEEKAA